MKEFKETTHTKIFTFSKSPFESQRNVPLYDSERNNESFIPSEFSSINQGYISPEDFLRIKQKRVQIIIDNEEDKHEFIKKIH